MPYKDREKQRQYQKEWSRKKFSDESAREQRRKIRSEWRGKRKEEINKYNLNWRKGFLGRKGLKKYRKIRVSEKKAWIEKLKSSSSCERCGEKNPVTLDFHHRNPDDKKHGIAFMVFTGHTLSALKEELKKCAVLCSNCHRIIHWEIRNSGL